MTLILRLEEIDYKMTRLVGGKAASLGEMIQAGLPVPGGFVVTTEAYKAFTQPLARDKVRSDANENMFYDQLLRAFDKLGVARVAVRSSAVAEDSADASWAGQLESYLNVTKEDLIETVSQCWQSIESDRAKHYADEHNVSDTDRAVAVVVQKMIDSEISGVMFTANPVTGNQDEIMIEAAYGLGEMIVQGVVTPESIVADKIGNIISRGRHRQTKQLVYKNGHNVEIEVSPRLQDRDILTESQVKQLAALAQKIEGHYNSPQDIEWAYANGQFYIVQSRPITTLSALQDKTQPSLPFHNDAEIFRWGPIRGNYFYISDYVTACYKHLPRRYKGRYFPETLLLFNNEHMVWLSDQTGWTDSGKGVFTNEIEKAEILGEMRKDWHRATTALIGFQVTIIPAALHQLEDKEFISVWQKFYATMMDFWVPTLLPELGNYGSPNLLKEDLKTYVSDKEELIRAQEVLTAPEEVSFYQQEEFQLIETTDLAAHQAKYFWLKNSYGHVEVLGEEFFKSRQAELIKAIQAPSPRELRQRAKAAKTDLQKQYDLPATLMKRAKLISDNIVWQDHRKRIMSENFHYKKLLLEELARRTGCQYADLVNLGFDEAIEILRAKRIAKRSSYHGVQFHKTLTRLSDEQAETYWHQYAHHATENVDTIQGVVASTGNKSIMRGRVRVLRSSHDILKPGEILVTAMTSPGYVFAMRQAAAVVTDIGGLTSHAAIVAREIGIPCIVGTKTASRVLKTGDMITIDVLRGIIKLVNEE